MALGTMLAPWSPQRLRPESANRRLGGVGLLGSVPRARDGRGGDRLFHQPRPPRGWPSSADRRWHLDPDWVQAVLDFTGGKGVDLIVDQVSGRWPNMRAKARIWAGARRASAAEDQFDADLHALRITIGVTFRTRAPEEVAEITRPCRPDPATPGASRAIDSVFPWRLRPRWRR